MNNTTPPEQLFLENIECPFEILSLTSFELGLLYQEVWE